MKKTVLAIAVLFVTLSSCTKDYSCTCVETDVYEGITTTYTYDYKIEEAKKSDARAACNEATIVFTEENYSGKTKCELKK